jgi:hypothetical protein
MPNYRPNPKNGGIARAQNGGIASPQHHPATPNPREVPCPLDLAANSLTAGSASQARRAALPPASHRLANKPLPFPFNTFQPLPVPNAATHPYNQIGGCRSPVHPHPWRKMQKKTKRTQFRLEYAQNCPIMHNRNGELPSEPKKMGASPVRKWGYRAQPSHTTRQSQLSKLYN